LISQGILDNKQKDNSDNDISNNDRKNDRSNDRKSDNSKVKENSRIVKNTS